MKVYCIVSTFVVMLLITQLGEGHFFTQPGTFLYGLNAVHKVFDISADGTIAVTLKTDSSNVQAALLTSFDPTSGAVFDNKTFGFGPLEVGLADTSNGRRVVVLTSEGGPRKIWVFSLDLNGKLTLLASTTLTTSGTDFGSNLALSGSSQTGFTIVSTADAFGSELVTFSLNDAAVLNRLATGNAPGQLLANTFLSMSETTNKRMLTFLKNFMTPNLEVIDVSNPSQPLDKGSIALPINGSYIGGGNADVAFSADGNYAFTTESYAELVVVDLKAMQTVGSISGNYACTRTRIHEGSQQRLLALQCSTAVGNSTDHGVALLVDATTVNQPQIVHELALQQGEFIYKDDLALSKNGTQLFVQTELRLLACTIPTLTNAWEEKLAGNPRSNGLMTYGERERVFGAWGSSSTLFGTFEGDRRRRSQVTSQ